VEEIIIPPTPAPVEEIIIPPTPAPVAPTPAPVTPAPVEPVCDFDMGTTGTTLCVPNDGVVLVGTKTGSGNFVPDGFTSDDLLHNIVQNGDMTVSFKVDNPFDFAVDMYVQHHVFAQESVNGALDAACNKKLAEPACNENADTITAACIEHGGDPFSLVSIFFVSNNSEITGEDSDAEPYECCHQEESTKGSDYGIVEYTFKVLCACPSEVRRGRRLRESKTDLEAWEEAIGGFNH